MNYLVALPNVSAPCPVNTCALADGSCFPCLPDGTLVDPAVVPSLSEWGLLTLGVLLAVVGMRRSG